MLKHVVTSLQQSEYRQGCLVVERIISWFTCKAESSALCLADITIDQCFSEEDMADVSVSCCCFEEGSIEHYCKGLLSRSMTIIALM
jgi:hypothetical protein